MPNVLVIAYYFPPAGGAGVQRTLKFVKYLPDFGWNPVVLTVQAAKASLKDDSLLLEVPHKLEILRTRAVLMPKQLPWRLRNIIARWLLVVDEQAGWIPFAISEGRRLIERVGIDAIYSTSSPASAHLVAEQLHRKSKIAWIADFRDPWVGNLSVNFPTRYHRRFIQNLEGRVCQGANLLSVVSEPMRQNLLKAYPEINPSKVVTLSNGYDPADYQGLQPIHLNPSIFHIVYTGSFYIGHRSPVTFLNAIRGLLDKGLLQPEKIKVHLIGNLGQPASQAIAATGLKDIVITSGYLPHKSSIAYLLAGDALLLIIGSTPGSEVVFTGKIFEYLAARKPVLALAPPGPAADLIHEARAGIVVDPEDIDAIQAAIMDIYQRWETGERKIDSRMEVVERFDRRRLAARLASLLSEAQNRAQAGHAAL